MNIRDYERLQADPTAVDSVASGAYYAFYTHRDPGFCAVWESVAEEEKALFAATGLAALYATVDDYTTSGCSCEYCTWTSPDTHGRLLMCEQRWARIPSDEQSRIAESVSD